MSLDPESPLSKIGACDRVQEEVLKFVLDAVRAEAFNGARTLFLFGSYTIGKERLFLEVARQLGKKVRHHMPIIIYSQCEG